MNNRHSTARRDLRDTTKIACRDNFRRGLCDIGQFPVSQAGGDLRLQHIMGTGRPAAEMAFRHVLHGEPGSAQKSLRQAFDFLAVLHGTGRVIGHPHPVPGNARRHVEFRQQFRDVLRLACNPCCLLGIDLILAQQKAVILHRCAATGRIDDDSIKAPILFFQRCPGIDVRRGPRPWPPLPCPCDGLARHNSGIFWHHHLYIVAGQQTDSRIID